MQTERTGTNEAGNRKAKRWGFRWYPDRASRGTQEQPGQPNRAGQDAQSSQIEPVEAKLDQAGEPSRSAGRPGRSRQPNRAAQRCAHPSWSQLDSARRSSWVTSLLILKDVTSGEREKRDMDG